MNKKHIISLAGDLASGKGAVSKELADRLNYEIYRNGEYFRKLAKEHNMEDVYKRQVEIMEILRPKAIEIAETVKTIIEKTPPEMLEGIKTKGIYMTGGGSLLYGMRCV